MALVDYKSFLTKKHVVPAPRFITADDTLATAAKKTPKRPRTSPHDVRKKARIDSLLKTQTGSENLVSVLCVVDGLKGFWSGALRVQMPNAVYMKQARVNLEVRESLQRLCRELPGLSRVLAVAKEFSTHLRLRNDPANVGITMQAWLVLYWKFVRPYKDVLAISDRLTTRRMIFPATPSRRCLTSQCKAAVEHRNLSYFSL